MRRARPALRWLRPLALVHSHPKLLHQFSFLKLGALNLLNLPSCLHLVNYK